MKKDKIQSMYKACSEEITSRTNEIQHLLLGEGNYDADIMIIPFLPSAKEEEYGQNILEDHRDKLLSLLDPLSLSIDDVYITHVMKYRPYRVNQKGRVVSRSPEQSELEFFIPYLEKEISLVNPKLIITLGNDSLSWLNQQSKMKINTEEDQLLVIGILGKSYRLYPIYSPSSKSFNKSIKRFEDEDLTRIRSIIYGERYVESAKDIQNAFAKEAAKLQSNPEDTKVIVKEVAKIMNEAKAEESLKNRVYNKITVEELSDDSKDHITIIYGGEGYLDDPVLVALERISGVLLELGIGIHRIDLYKGSISMEKALTYLNHSIGVVFGVNVEWFGIGYRMQEFLDNCFKNGKNAYFLDKPMMGVVFTRHGFERAAYDYLRQSWEVLGGREGTSMCAAIELASKLETNFDWLYGIDKKTESYYRVLRQDKGILPSSNNVEQVSIETPITDSSYNKNPNNQGVYDKPKASIDSGIIENYDEFVEKQQEDIKAISSIFKKKLSSNSVKKDNSIPGIIKGAYIFKDSVESTIQLLIDDDIRENTVIELNDQHVRSYYGQIAAPQVSVSGKRDTMMKILRGKLSMQRAFMTGEVKAKGDFTILYKFEEYFSFK